MWLIWLVMSQKRTLPASPGKSLVNNTQNNNKVGNTQLMPNTIE